MQFLAKRIELGSSALVHYRDDAIRVARRRRCAVIHRSQCLVGQRTLSPRSRSTENACGDVTSWVR